MQKVSVFLDEKGLPAMGELVTQTVVEAVCNNFNALRSAGFVTIQLDYTEAEPLEIFNDGYGILSSMSQPYKPTVRLIPAPNNGAVLQIKIPQ